MSDFKYDDLKFIVEKFIDWEEIARVKGCESTVEEYMMTLETTATFCENQVEPKAEEVDKEECHLKTNGNGSKKVCVPEAMEKNLQSLMDLGLFCGPTFPEENGGFNFPMTAFFAMGEIFSMADSSIGLTPMLQEGVGQVIIEFANEKIKSEYLPKLVSGESYGGMGLTEPDAGSDLAVMKTTARAFDPAKDELTDRIKELQDLGEVYIINGSKIFITNGFGDVLTLAKTTPDSISMFLVFEEDKEVSRVEKKLGIKGSPTCELYYENSPGVLIGEIGGGLVPNMMKLMNIARLGVATQGLGIAQKAHAMATNYATNERVQFGIPIINHPQVRQIIYENEINLQATRALIYTASFYFDMRESLREKLMEADKESSEYAELKKEHKKYDRIADILIPLAKYDAAELSNSITYSSLQVYGGSGFTKEFPLERLYRDARITSIYEGTSQIQIGQVFNESFTFEKLGLINQYKMGGNQSFVENDKNILFTDKYLNELKDEIKQKANGQQAIGPLLESIEISRKNLKEGREILFLEERKRGKEEGKKYNSLYQKDYVDTLGGIIKSYLLLKQSLLSEGKIDVAKSYIERLAVTSGHSTERIKSGIDDVINETYSRVIQ